MLSSQAKVVKPKNLYLEMFVSYQSRSTLIGFVAHGFFPSQANVIAQGRIVYSSLFSILGKVGNTL